jgi:hypothetical protein
MATKQATKETVEAVTYTLGQIKDLWSEYQSTYGWRVLRGGKWAFSLTAPDTSGGASKAEMLQVKNHYSFPKYLELKKNE